MSKTKAKITSLTPEQEAKKAIYIEKFKQIALSTEPTDKAKAEKAIKDFYKYVNKPEPRIIWFDSPARGIEMAARCSTMGPGLTAEQIIKNPNWTFDQIEKVEITKKEIQDMAYKTFFGSFEAHYFCFYEFASKELPVETDNLIDVAVSICEQLGCHWLFDEAAILTTKPVEIHVHDNTLHNTTGPALRYADGEEMYFIKGEFKKSLMDIALEKAYKNESE